MIFKSLESRLTWTKRLQDKTAYNTSDCFVSISVTSVLHDHPEDFFMVGYLDHVELTNQRSHISIC